MASVTFDTLKFVEKLKAAGVPEAQAKAEAEALQGVFAEALDTQLATKADIVRLERRMDGVEGKMEARFERIDGKLTLVQWMLALVVASEVVPLLAKLFQ
jgi:hypothetical protein